MRRIRPIAWLLPVLLVPVLLLAGCSRPAPPGNAAAPASASAEAEKQALQAELKQLQAKNQQLQAKVADLESQARVRPLPAPVNLIDANYPPAVAGPGWNYHKRLSADLDSDGQKEQVSLITNAAWDPERKEFAWDDGHPWHVYIQEADGTRTYLFSGWVQMGRLDAIADQESPGFYLINTRPGSLSVHRITYRGPGRAEVIPLLDIPLSDFATLAEP